MRRAISATYPPVPVAALSNEVSTRTSTSLADTDDSRPVAADPFAVSRIRPVPPDTENPEAVPISVQEPPVFAAPNPLVVVRVKVSAAYVVTGGGAGAVADG